MSERLSAGPTESLDAIVRLSHHKIDKTAYAKFVKCFQTCFCFRNLHIGVKEMFPKLILRQSYIAILSVRTRSGIAGDFRL